jgi:dUTP pyrophosphatase
MIRFKRIGNHDFPLPSRAYGEAAAFDLCSTESIILRPGDTHLVGTGWAVDLNGFAALILPRSGMGNKGLVLGNLVGLIDPDYRGELKVSLWNRTKAQPIPVKAGDKIAQMMVVPFVAPMFEEVFDLEETDRGIGGFGSSDG